jgi:hypothetical protein
MLKELIIAESNKVTKLAYDASQNTFKRAGTKSIKDIKKILFHNNNLLLWKKNTLCLLDGSFNEIASTSFQSVGSVFKDGRFIYAGAEGCFICFDERLNELGRVRFDFGYMGEMGGKNIDCIAVHNDIAYLVDDIINPLFIFSADISDRSTPKIIGEYSFESVNAHLALQLLNPELDQWIVKENYGHMGGSGEVLHFFKLSQSTSEIIMKASRSVFKWTTFEIEPAKGYRIKDATIFPPFWAVVLDPQNNLSLCKLSTTNERVRFTYHTVLEQTDFESNSYWRDDFDYALKQIGSKLFVCNVFGCTEYMCEEDLDYIPLWIFDVTGKRPQQLSKFDLTDYAVKAVVDFAVRE